MQAKHIFKELGTFAFFLSGAFLLASLAVSVLPAQQVSANEKVGICHATGGGKYVSLSIDVSSLDKWLSQGHGTHGGDIWAGFTTDDGHSVPGQGDIGILNNACEVPAIPTDTSVPPTSTDAPVPPTPTGTLIPPVGASTAIPLPPTGTLLPPSFTDTPIPATPTMTLVLLVPPASVGSNVLLPVTGVDMGAFSRGLPRAFANLCLGFLGLGLVLHGIARRYDR